MTGNVKIKIESLHREEGVDEQEKMNFEAVGTAHEKGGSTYIMFDEIQEDMPPVKCMIKIYGGEVWYRKKGAVTSEILLSLGEEYRTVYQTPYGGFGVKIKTNSLSIIEGDNAINIRAEYELTMQEDYVRTCEISINIKTL